MLEAKKPSAANRPMHATSMEESTTIAPAPKKGGAKVGIIVAAAVVVVVLVAGVATNAGLAAGGLVVVGEADDLDGHRHVVGKRHQL